MEREDIIAKIRKLLKLQYGAEKIGSTGEAYQAARMVQKLLLEYNLQMSDIGEAEEGDTTRITESDGIPYADQYGNTWKLQLMNVICKFNLCRCLYNGPTRRMTIVGAEANVIICREFYQYLLKVFTRLSMDRLNEAQNEAMRNRRFLTEDKKKEYVRSYLEGVGQGLYENYGLRGRQKRQSQPAGRLFGRSCQAQDRQVNNKRQLFTTMNKVFLIVSVIMALAVSVSVGILVLALIGAGLAEEEIARHHLYED